MEETRITLLARLGKAGDGTAWRDFYDRYAPVILSFAMRHGMPQSQAEDVLQETMMVLLREMPAFSYDPVRGRFRNFLLSIVYKRCIAARRREQSDRRVIEFRAPNFMNEIADPFAETPLQQIEAAWRLSVEEEAWQRVRTEGGCDKLSADIFESYVRRGRPAAEVARENGVNVNQVYQAKNRLEKRLLREMELMLEGMGEGVKS